MVEVPPTRVVTNGKGELREERWERGGLQGRGDVGGMSYKSPMQKHACTI